MKVKELIELLQKEDPEMKVSMTVDGRGGYIKEVRKETFVTTVVDLYDGR